MPQTFGHIVKFQCIYSTYKRILAGHMHSKSSEALKIHWSFNECTDIKNIQSIFGSTAKQEHSILKCKYTLRSRLITHTFLNSSILIEYHCLLSFCSSSMLPAEKRNMQYWPVTHFHIPGHLISLFWKGNMMKHQFCCINSYCVPSGDLLTQCGISKRKMYFAFSSWSLQELTFTFSALH